MRLYRRSKAVDLNDTIACCYFDADRGRVWLALERLQDLEDELGPDTRISYEEGVMRRDSLGQGLRAYQLFETSYQQDSNHFSAVSNAVGLSPNEETFRRWAPIAMRYSEDDESNLSRVLQALDDGTLTYLDYRRQQAAVYQHASRPGTVAAILEVILATETLPPEEELKLRLARAQALRMVDMEAARHYEQNYYTFLPEDRLALQGAVEEIDRCLTLDEYDAEKWNFKAAWCALLQRYEEAIAAADHAIELRPYNYPRPYQNKALALYRLERYDEAREALNRGKEEAQRSKSAPDIEEIAAAERLYGTPPASPTLEHFYPVSLEIVKAAGVDANYLAGLMKGTMAGLTAGFSLRLKANPTTCPLDYVGAMGQLLAYMAPEAGFCSLNIIGDSSPGKKTLCLQAALYIAVHGEPVMRRDAARLLALSVILAPSPAGMQANYRQLIMLPSAAATDNMADLRAAVDVELSRFNLFLPELLANQRPLSTEEIETTRQGVLNGLTGEPFINNSASFGKPAGCCAPTALIALIVMLGLITLITIKYANGTFID